MVLAPVVRGRKGEYEALLADLARDGFSRARIDGEIRELTDEIKLDRYVQHTIEVVVDRLVRREGIERRLSDSLETALHIAEGVAKVEVVDGPTLTFSQHLACAYDGTSFEELQPRNFSFNSPYGACQVCLGIGTQFQVDPDLVIPDPDLSIADGAVVPWAGTKGRYFQRLLEGVAADPQVRHRPAMGQAPPPGEADGSRRDRRPAHQGVVHQPVREDGASTPPATRESSLSCGVVTPMRRATPPASTTRSTCARSRATHARGPGSTRSPWR